MRKFIKAFLLSIILLFSISNTTSPHEYMYNTDMIDKVANWPFSLRELTSKYNVSIMEAYDITNYPILFPLNKSDVKRISSEFGMRRHPILGIQSHHDGIDISSEIGANIRSTGNGIVFATRQRSSGYGKQILIKHENGYITRYAHLNEILVNEGDTVKISDIIATVGNTGLSTGPHLHYEIIYNGEPIDPMSIYSDTLKQNTYLAQAYEISEYILYSDQIN